MTVHEPTSSGCRAATEFGRNRRYRQRVSSVGAYADSGLVTHVVGARPNLPKAAPVIRALADRGVRQRLVHTGQHYDDALSESFFRDLDLPRPDVNLGVGSASHAQQTASLLTALEAEVTRASPQLLVVYGDINSTLAAALVASKLGISLAHVEAGLRSFDRTMPEEINRVVTDQLSTLLFTTSPEAHDNLIREGLPTETIHFVGNPMIDTLLANVDALDSQRVQARLGVEGAYAVATLHRPGNVDNAETAQDLVSALDRASTHLPVVIPLHPRGRAVLISEGLGSLTNVSVLDPLGYLDFMSLVKGSLAVITDSGGVQEETTVLGVPCLTLRPNTERPITISHGTNRLVTTANLATELVAATNPSIGASSVRPPLWDGNAGGRIATVIEKWMATA